MTFAIAKSRLLAYLRYRLRNGEITERGLAHKVGLSQSHVHNVLKGERELSGDVADRILLGLGMSLLDLCKRDELVSHLSVRPLLGHDVIG